MSANGSFDDPSTANLIIGKDVSAKGKGSTKGVVGEAANGGVTNIDISKGAVTVNSEESSATGIRMDANGSYDDPEKASTAKLTIGKDVTAIGKYANGIIGNSTFGSEVTIEAGGNVTAESKKGNAYALTIDTTGEKSKATVMVAGNVIASSDENGYGIRIGSQGGEATATVTGDVESIGTGIYASSGGQYRSFYSLTQQEIDAIKDKLTLVNDNGNSKPEHTGQAKLLLTKLYNHQAEQYRLLAVACGKEAVEKTDGDSDAVSELANAWGTFIPDWNCRNHHALIAWYSDYCRRNPKNRSVLM